MTKVKRKVLCRDALVNVKKEEIKCYSILIISDTFTFHFYKLLLHILDSCITYLQIKQIGSFKEV